MVRALFPAAQSRAPSSNAAQHGKQSARPSWPPGRAYLLRLASALSSWNEPIVRYSQTLLLKTEASGAWSATSRAPAELPAEIPCPACDLLHPGPELRSLKG